MIEFGEGATILVAPNGMGKTTIFEAIELAITGSIQRLKNEIGAFVSDGLDNMFVILEFNDNQYTKIVLNKYGKKMRDKDIFKILEVQQDISVPYLYKMTHFFEQNSKNWFVSCDGTEAGKLLNSLPISRDVQNVLSKKTSLIRAFTNIEKAFDTELKSMKEVRNLFEEDMKKLEKMDSYMTRDEYEVKSLARQYNVNIIDDDNAQLDKLFINLESVKSNITERRDLTKSILSKLTAFKDRIDFYLSNQQLLKDKNEIVILYKKQKEDKEKDLQEFSGYRHEVVLKRRAEEEIKARIQLILLQFSELDTKTENLNEKNVILKKYQSDLDKVSQEIMKKEEDIKRSCKNLDKQEALNRLIKARKESMIALRNKAKNLTEWKSKKLEMARNAQKLKDLENKIARKNISIEDITLKLQKYKKEYQDKQENLSNLKKSEEETLNALFIIKKIIGPETKVCPV